MVAWLTSLLPNFLGVVVEKFVKGFSAALSEWRRDKALETKGALSVANKALEEYQNNVEDKQRIAERLRRDVDYIELVRNRFRDSG